MKTKLALIALISLTVFACSTDDFQGDTPNYNLNKMEFKSDSKTEDRSIFMREGDTIDKNQDSTQIIPNPIPVIGEPIKPTKD